jgi:hypothetical protein
MPKILIIFFHGFLNLKESVTSIGYNHAIFTTSMSLNFGSMLERTCGLLHELPVVRSPLEVISIGNSLQWWKQYVVMVMCYHQWLLFLGLFITSSGLINDDTLLAISGTGYSNDVLSLEAF